VVEPVRLLEYAIDARWADGYHVVVEHHEGQAAIPFKRMTVVKIDNGLFFPVLEPPVAGDLAVVLVDFAVTVLPVVELASAQAEPTQEPTRWKLRAAGPMLDVVDDLITRVMGNPGSVQGSPSSFFSCTCSCINSAITSFFWTSLDWSRSTSFA
jgi:hypothetical protein